MNPHHTTKAVCGHVAKYMLMRMKAMFPNSFVHGRNCSQLETMFCNKANKLDDPVFLSFDGSAFDAH
jgi:hypothetical protein